MAQSNYANQFKRISKDAKRADFVLIYYSLSLIVYNLSTKFYPNLFAEDWISYSSVILSIIVLIYSIINSKAGYPGRIHTLEKALNRTKRLKRDVGELPDRIPQDCPASRCQGCEGDGQCIRLESLKEEYDKLVSSTEIRDDIDFYYTIQHLCKQYHINIRTGEYKGKDKDDKPSDDVHQEIKGYISENKPLLQKFHVVANGFWHFCLYVAPVVIFILGYFFSNR